MTPREKLKAFFAQKKQEEREENKKQYIERQIDEEIDYKETIQTLTNIYKINMAYWYNI